MLLQVVSEDNTQSLKHILIMLKKKQTKKQSTTMTFFCIMKILRRCKILSNAKIKLYLVF